MEVTPRMTGALRAFSEVSANESLLTDGSDLTIKKFMKKPPSDEYTWQDITSVLHQHISKDIVRKDEIAKSLKQFQQTVISFGEFDIKQWYINIVVILIIVISRFLVGHVLTYRLKR